MIKKRAVVFLLAGIVLSGLVWTGHHFIFGSSTASAEAPAVQPVTEAQPAEPKVIVPNKPKYVRGIHMTSWVTGSAKQRAAFNRLFEETELNTAVIDIKEYEGEVYIPYGKAKEFKAYVPAIPDTREYLAGLKAKGIYPIARIVVFKDNIVPLRKPEWAVMSAEGGVWKDHAGNTWVDPYNKEVWDYNLSLAEHAIDLGFEEIQFDYIRFPSDGRTRNCRYSQIHSSMAARGALVGFLKEANRRLKAKGANLSIDVFGLTTTVPHDMGIGQKITEMTEWVDYVSPMVYPSHYAKGEYGIPNPNAAPYHTVYLGMTGAKKKLGPAFAKMRPYLQDFSLGHRYGINEVRAQIQACYDTDVPEWLLWNPRCVYTRGALKEKKEGEVYEKKDPPEYVLSKPKAPATAVQPVVYTSTAPEVHPSSATVK